MNRKKEEMMNEKNEGQGRKRTLRTAAAVVLALVVALTSAQYSFAAEEDGTGTAGTVSAENGQAQQDSSRDQEAAQTENPSAGEPDPEPEPADTKVTGIKTKITKKANRSISMKLTVENGAGRKLLLQEKTGGKWKDAKKYTIPEDGRVTVNFPKKWYSPAKSTWRVYIAASDQAKAYSKDIKVTAKRVFQNPKRYFQVKDIIPQRRTTYTLKAGYSGYKAYKVRKKFHMGGANMYSTLYTHSVAARVKRFQRRHGLRATGRVNLATWKKLGYSEHSWYYLDSYVSPIKVTAKSTKKQCIEAMIRRAKQYRGTKYVWCAAAKPGQGVDCAGLVIQSLYAAGIDPLPQGSHVYAYPRNEYTTRRMWANKKFKHVSFSNRKRGDIIYYPGHVTIYLGHGKMIESLAGGVHIRRVRFGAVGCLRPFV